MNGARNKSGRSQLLLIAAIFIGPLVVAGWLYYQGKAAQPTGRSNHGALLEPIVNIGDALPDSTLHAHNAGRWLLVYKHQGLCDAACRDALYTIRQSRLMLGKEMDRVGRIFLHGSNAPDTVFLAEEHQGLVAIQDDGLTQLLNKKKPGNLSAGGYYLIDPLGNLVLYFHPEIDPGEMIDDLKRLLRLSRIG